ncbi:hypothetical protein, partial [Pectobacterium quasiaquaticum]|uniref:hypothetical protein n=1 Tax=Pectobacterium quasiaquaticum TaxID=2774015 RepID=UPI001CF78671
ESRFPLQNLSSFFLKPSNTLILGSYLYTAYYSSWLNIDTSKTLLDTDFPTVKNIGVTAD